MANAFHGAVEQHAVERALGLEHADDTLHAVTAEQLLGALASLGQQSLPVDEAQAAP